MASSLARSLALSHFGSGLLAQPLPDLFNGLLVFWQHWNERLPDMDHVVLDFSGDVHADDGLGLRRSDRGAIVEKRRVIQPLRGHFEHRG